VGGRDSQSRRVHTSVRGARYVTDRLAEDVSEEIVRARPVQLVNQPLIKAQAKSMCDASGAADRFSNPPETRGREWPQRSGSAAAPATRRWRDQPTAEQAMDLAMWSTSCGFGGATCGVGPDGLMIRHDTWAESRHKTPTWRGAHLSRPCWRGVQFPNLCGTE